jgi:predicted dehydrogenase
MTTNIGIIGFGSFGQFLYDSFKQVRHLKVTALADSKKNRDPGHTKFYTDWKDIIKDDGVDIVWISTVPDVHAEIACAALYAGKDVIIEKPVATNIKDAKQILKVRDKTGKMVTVNYMMRFNPISICIADFTQRNVFGSLRRVNVENYAQDETLPIKHWFWNKEVSGGILIEHAVHFIDLVNYFSNQQFRTVNGMAHKRKSGQEDQVFATVLYEKGLIASHYHSFSRPSFFERTTIRMSFDLAEIDIEGWIPLKGHIRALVNNQSKSAIKRLPNVDIVKENKISTFIAWLLFFNHNLFLFALPAKTSYTGLSLADQIQLLRNINIPLWQRPTPIRRRSNSFLTATWKKSLSKTALRKNSHPARSCA